MLFPNIDPIIFQIGYFAIRWYSLAYIAGIFLGYFYTVSVIIKNKKISSYPHIPRVEQTKDIILFITIGIIVGGRLGYVIFYNLEYFLDNPLKILHIWEGGMSFHGGAIGIILAFFLYARLYKIHFLSLCDIFLASAPIGIFLGRIANFINSELWGRTTHVPWGIIFPNGGSLPRHPSQLYEAFLEGVVPFILLAYLIYYRDALKKPGFISGISLVIYAIARIFVEQFRQPDAHIGFLVGGTTMGFWLSIPMIFIGIYCIFFSYKHK